MAERNTIIFDQGSSKLKLGYSGEDAPRHCVPTNSSMLLREVKSTLICDHEEIGRRDAACNYPMKGGIVQDWDAMEQLWDYAFGSLMEIDKETAMPQLLMTQSPLETRKQRDKIIEYMFESMNIGKIALGKASSLVLYAQGLLTGLVVECGDGVTHVEPVYEGFCPCHLIKRHPVTGRSITEYLAKLLQRRGYRYGSMSNIGTIKDVKEKLCYATSNLNVDKRLAQETTVLDEDHILPDGTKIKIGHERFEATEAFFDPSLIGMDCKGISDLVFDTIQECDIDCRLQYYQHIVLSGGSSMFPGMAIRLQNDVRERYLGKILKGDEERLKKFKIQVEAPPYRDYTVFMGGSVLGDLMKDCDNFWMSKGDYEELGIDKALANCRI